MQTPATTAKALGLVLLVLALGIPSTAEATLIRFDTVLTGAQETPPVPTAAMGLFSMMFDDVTRLVDFSVVLQGLTRQELTGFHLHVGPPGVSGPIIFRGTPEWHLGFMDLPGGLIQLTVTGALFPTMATGCSPAGCVGDLLAGNIYVNVHNMQFPGGVIRGQLPAGGGVIPEPASLLLVGSGLALLGRTVRRRKTRE